MLPGERGGEPPLSGSVPESFRCRGRPRQLMAGRSLSITRGMYWLLNKRPPPAKTESTMQSKRQSSALKFVITLLWIFDILISSASAQQEFIVTGDRIINSRVSGEYVRLSERLPISQLKRRFARYKITSAAGEDCAICATVSRNAFHFEVYYDVHGIVVTGIYCRDNACVDALGNRVGESLRQALGNLADCDNGDELTCEFRRLSGIWYIVRENNKCTLRVTESGKKTSIPACARIGGFQILKLGPNALEGDEGQLSHVSPSISRRLLAGPAGPASPWALVISTLLISPNPRRFGSFWGLYT